MADNRITLRLSDDARENIQASANPRKYVELLVSERTAQVAAAVSYVASCLGSLDDAAEVVSILARLPDPTLEDAARVTGSVRPDGDCNVQALWLARESRLNAAVWRHLGGAR